MGKKYQVLGYHKVIKPNRQQVFIVRMPRGLVTNNNKHMRKNMIGSPLVISSSNKIIRMPAKNFQTQRKKYSKADVTFIFPVLLFWFYSIRLRSKDIH